jgi:hypothetical protein
VTVVSSIAGRSVRAWLEASHYVRPDDVISKRDAAGTVTPSANGAIELGSEPTCAKKK